MNAPLPLVRFAVVSIALAFAPTTLLAVDVIDNLPNAVDTFSLVLDDPEDASAQAFRTGPEFTTLDTVTFRLGPVTGQMGSVRFELWSGEGQEPEMKLETVGTTPVFSADDEFTEFSTTNTLLAPNTRYWIVAVYDSGSTIVRATNDGILTFGSVGEILQLQSAYSTSLGDWFSYVPDTYYNLVKITANPVPGVTVTRAEDDMGGGTLREAIAAADPGARITFAPTLAGATILLNGTELTIDKSLIIDASNLAGGITLCGDRTGGGPSPDDSRVFFVEPDSLVTLHNLVVTGGRTGDDENGGGIFNSGTLTLQHCSIAGNRSGDGSPGGSDGGSGGGIMNVGSLTLLQSTVSGNSSGDGSDNLAGTPGNGGYGGGIYNDNGTVTLRQSTVSGNRAGDGGDGGATGEAGYGGEGGGVSNDGLLILQETTIYGNSGGDGGDRNDSTNGTSGLGGNGGGIDFNGGNYMLEITNSIVAGNAKGEPGVDVSPFPGGADIEVDVQTTRFGVNLIGDNSTIGGAASAVFPSPTTPGDPNANGDLVGTDVDPLDPLLGALSDNGGPTLTHLPLRGSPALDPPGGVTTYGDFTTDQRGLDRIVAGVQDIGAVEAPDYAVIDARGAAQAAALAAFRAVQQAQLSKKIKKLRKKAKIARRKGQKAKGKRLKKKFKKLKKRLRAL